MNDEKRLSEAELAAIEERLSKPLVIIAYPVFNTPESIDALIEPLKQSRQDTRALLAHIRTLQTDLAIANAARSETDWFAKP